MRPQLRGSPRRGRTRAMSIVVAVCAATGACRDAERSETESPPSTRERIPVEVRVTADDARLRELLEVAFRDALDANQDVTPVVQGGDWIIDIHAAGRDSIGARPVDAVDMSIQVLEPEPHRHEFTDREGRPAASVVGGDVTCAVKDLGKTCYGVVADVAKFAKWVANGDARLAHRLRDGETDLIDDDFVRTGQE